MIITDHVARPETVIGCLSISQYCGTNQHFITWFLYSVYLHSGKMSSLFTVVTQDHVFLPRDFTFMVHSEYLESTKGATNKIDSH